MRLRGTTVLLVDADLDNLEVLALCLEAEGAQVLQASSIARALLVSAGRRVDVVVADLDLPDGDGGGLLHQLRARDKLGTLPAIAVSGYSQAQWRSRGSSLGFHRYAFKPFSIGSLVDLITSLTRGDADDESAMI